MVFAGWTPAKRCVSTWDPRLVRAVYKRRTVLMTVGPKGQRLHPEVFCGRRASQKASCGAVWSKLIGGLREQNLYISAKAAC